VIIHFPSRNTIIFNVKNCLCNICGYPSSIRCVEIVNPISYFNATISADTTATFFDASGQTYKQNIEEILKQARLMIGDSSGFVYEFDPTHTQYAGNNITSRHVTHVEDFEQPDRFKRWNWISVVARNDLSLKSNGSVKIRYRIDNFDTSDTGWISTNVTKTIFDIEDDCISRWKMNDNTNNATVLDSIGSNNGTAQQNTSVLTTTGKINEALTFDGLSDFIDTGSTFQSTFRSSFTISSWVKPDDGQPSPSPYYICGSRNSTVEDQVNFLIPTGADAGKLRLELVANNESVLTTTDNAVFSNGQEVYHHVVAVINSVTKFCDLYFDGVLVKSQDISAITDLNTFTTDRNLYIGAGNNGVTESAWRFFTGDIDNVMIFNEALSSTEILGLYNSGSGTEELSSSVQPLTNDWKEYKFFNNRSSRKIQYEFDNASGSNFQISEIKIGEPQIQDDR
ncbi:MAG TPA: LamG domain-containing protein, partial [bacterium]|nr:LamG domain-containing protein [bacterium]